MSKTVSSIATAITSLGMVVFVLLMTVIAMIFVGHGLYYQVFVKCMPSSHAEIAAWILSCGIETTVLVITANVKYFSSKQLPIFFAVCSGFIVLFFIDAFNTMQPTLEIAVRWFIGLLVCGLNYVYSELFVKKFNDEQQANEMLKQIETLKQENEEYSQTFATIRNEMSIAKEDHLRLLNYVGELEEYKQREIAKLTCKCGRVFETIYKLTSHKGICQCNPKNGMKKSIFEEVGIR